MRGFLRRWLLLAVVCGAGLTYLVGAGIPAAGQAATRGARAAGQARGPGGRAPNRPPAGAAPHGSSWWQHVWSVDTRKGIVELLGTHDGSRVGWNRHIAEWGGLQGPHWWQSALAMLTLMHYAMQTDYHSPLLEHVLEVTYKRNIWKPRSDEKFDFINQYMDDTVWWGLAWLNASEYELYYRHNVSEAQRYLAVAETDAGYVANRRQCGGIVWELGSPAGTITNAEYIALTAELSQYRRSSSTFHDPGLADRWLADSRQTLSWLQRTGLVSLSSGTIKDTLASHRCHTLLGGPLAYSEGEVADALVQMGIAMNDPTYYQIAARFLRYVLDPAHGFVVHGVLRSTAKHARSARTTSIATTSPPSRASSSRRCRIGRWPPEATNLSPSCAPRPKPSCKTRYRGPRETTSVPPRTAASSRSPGAIHSAPHRGRSG